MNEEVDSAKIERDDDGHLVAASAEVVTDDILFDLIDAGRRRADLADPAD